MASFGTGIKIIAIVGGAVLLLARPCPAGAQAGMSMDEFVEYSVKNLQNKISELNEENNSLRQKIDALRSRILFLRQEMRDMDDRRLGIIEARGGIAESGREGRKDVPLAQDRTKFLLEKRGNLFNEQSLVKEQLHRREKRQKELEEKVGSAQAGLQDVQAQYKQNTGATGQLQQPEVKRLENLIANSQKAAVELQRQITVMQQSLVKPRQEQVLAQKTYAALQDQLLQAQQNIQVVISREQGLSQDNRSAQEVRNGLISSEQNKFTQREEYFRQLTDVVAALRRTHAKIFGQADAEQKKMQGIREALLGQRSLLQDQLAAARATADLKKAAGAPAAESTSLAGSLSGLDAKQRQLETTVKAAQEKITQQQDRSRNYDAEEKSLNGELAGLTRKMDEIKSRPAGNSGLAGRKTEIAGLIKEKNKQLADLQEQLKSLQGRKEQSATSQSSIETQNKEFQKNITALQKDLVKMDTAIGVTNKAREKIIKNQAGSLEENKLAIRDMEARKIALTNSVRLIQSRYDSQEIAVKDFQKEQVQLQKYISVLNIENEGLTEKLEALQESISGR
jgi:chromosome segregation ATPase